MFKTVTGVALIGWGYLLLIGGLTTISLGNSIEDED